ncbi:hypothetical protein K474DRAFT_1124303 [Panus rudis PR-1116 ss-1]|nr:hypothetical protein K474DRAFT_1124303 [Panus rudis PR-1116 ss-1]
MPLSSKQFVVPFTGFGGQDLKMVVTRYSAQPQPPDTGLVLLCLHSIGAHKELWLPTLEPLFADSSLNIGEAWAIDGQQHGDSLPLNQRAAEENLSLLCESRNPGRAVVEFFKTNLIPHKGRQCVIIGHSAGCHSIIHSAMDYLKAGQPVPFSIAIMIEPALFPEKYWIPFSTQLKRAMAARKWQWKSKEEAAEYIAKFPPTNTWSPEIRKLYVEYGMIHTEAGSRLKMPAFVEAACYPNTEGQVQGFNDFPTVCEKVTVHVLLGSRCDFVPKPLREQFVHFAKSRVRSMHTIEGVGHLAIQNDPKRCAEAIKAILIANTDARL